MSQGIPGIVIDWGTVAELTTVIAAIAGFIVWLHPKMKKLMDMLDDWTGEDARPGVPRREGVMERLEKIEDKVNKNDSHDFKLDEQMSMLKDIIRRMDNEDSH